MTKQQIVVQQQAAKIANSEYVYDEDIARYGKLADKIMEMFPEPSYEFVYKGSINNEQVIDELLRAMEA